LDKVDTIALVVCCYFNFTALYLSSELTRRMSVTSPWLISPWLLLHHPQTHRYRCLPCWTWGHALSYL